MGSPCSLVHARLLINHSDDMTKPILEILQSKADYFEGGRRGVEAWRQDIDHYAPGYLDAEEAAGGLALDYDHPDFTLD